MKLIAIVFLLVISAVLHSCHSEQIKKKGPSDPLCSQLPKPGRCKGRIESYFFDLQEKKCRPFYWGGCGGSRPFASEEECQARCQQ